VPQGAVAELGRCRAMRHFRMRHETGSDAKSYREHACVSAICIKNYIITLKKNITSEIFKGQLKEVV
jgi:hypothetical protein